jgi:hypothetical protein
MSKLIPEALLKIRVFADLKRQVLPNEEPRRKQRGIFVGAEIYFTGGVHTRFAYVA